MSYVTILWSMAAAAALLLGVVHALIWVNDRRARSGLAFALLAFSVAAVAITELGMMYARTPEEWGAWVRWCHLPLFFLVLGTFVFVRLYLNAGHWWLIAAILTLRIAILVDNFTSYPNFNFERIDTVSQESFLGEPVTVVGSAVHSRWQWLATASGVLYLLFILDAFIEVWRRGTSDDRRKALLIGGGIVTFISVAFANTQLVIWGVVRTPMLITPAFLIPLFAMAYELSRDVLHASRIARELRESERRLDLAASSAGLGLCTWHGNGWAWATKRARELLGIGAAETLEIDRVAAKVHPDDIAALREQLQRAFAGGGDCSAEFRVLLPDGRERWILGRGRADARIDGKPPTLRGVMRDVTDQKQAETEAERLRSEIAHIGRVTTLGQLTTSLAHELAQPLGAILRNAEAAEILLDRSSPDLDELRAIVTDIHRDDRRASEIIERLRALLQRRQLRFEPIALDALVRDVDALVRPDATARHIRLRYELDARLPFVSGDRVHLSQVLLNLLINALDATTDTRRSRQVVIQARAQAARTVELAVTDWGSGIPPDCLSRVFDPFFTTKAAGMGMGLAVSRTIVEAHGGRLWAENVPDGGARFRLILPAAEGLAA
jgi:PAS domain S-box-containing protein